MGTFEHICAFMIGMAIGSAVIWVIVFVLHEIVSFIQNRSMR